MSIMYILIPIAIILTAIGIYLFFWAVKTEQFEDLEKQGMSILFDDKPQEPPHSTTDSSNTSNTSSGNLTTSDIKKASQNNTEIK